MAKKDRTGNRKTREQRKQFKVPELGYYLIVTDTEATERCFFTGLHQALSEDVRNKLVIKVVETKTRAMIDKCLELTAYDAQYRIPWIVFDRDQVQDFDEIIKEAEDKGIQVGWSNPCFEIWMYAYFGSMPAIHDSWTCCSEFGRVYESKTKQKYSKADEQMYGKLCKVGDELKAIQIAQRKLEQCKREGKIKPSEMCPCTTADLFLYQVCNAYELAEDENSRRESCWFPTCYVYAKSAPIEWMKMKSRQYCQKMMVLFGVSSIEELKGVVGKCVYDSRMKYTGSWDAAPGILNYIKVDEIGILN